jgi:hypothetical protein
MDPVFRLLGLATAAWLVAVILWSPDPWFHDFSEWLFQAKILSLKLTQPGRVEQYMLANYPVPNSLAIFFLAGLCLFLSPIIAGKVYLILQILAWVWLLSRYVRRFVPDESQGGVFLVLTSILTFSSFFWYGFISYQLALSILVLYVLRCNGRMTAAENAVFGILLFMSHAMVALAWGVMVIATATRRASSATPGVAAFLSSFSRNAAPLLAPALLATWYIAGRFSSPTADIAANAQMSGAWEGIVYKIGYPLMLGSFRNILQPDGQAVFEAWPIVYLLGAASNVAIVLLLSTWGLRVFWSIRPNDPRQQRSTMTGWGLAAWLLILLYLLMPYDFFGLINPAGRLLLPLLIILIAVAPSSTFRCFHWAAIPAFIGVMISAAGYTVLSDDLAHANRSGLDVSFLPAKEQVPKNSVLGFNAALYSNTRFAYFNYRVLIGHKRFDQLRAQQYQGLGFRTGPIIGYVPR